MSRRIQVRSLRLQSGGDTTESAQDNDTFTDRIVKLLPADVVAGWLAVTTALKSSADKVSVRTLWIIFAFGVFFAAAWTWRRSSEPGKPKPYLQTGVSTVGFAVWAYVTGGTLPLWPGNLYHPLTATLLLVAFSLASGLLTKA